MQERPFDYPGRHSDLPPEPTETLLGSFNTHDEDGEAYTVYAVYSFHALCDKDEIEERVHEMHPVWHCEHSFDCCANFYPSRAMWSFAAQLDRYNPEGPQTVVVTQRFLCNI